jgi:hypothetical protein
MPSNDFYLHNLSMILKKNHENLINSTKKFNVPKKETSSTSTNIHSSDYYSGYCNNSSPTVSYTSNNNAGYSSMNVTFTSLIG